MHPGAISRAVAAVCAFVVTACGPERNLSGVWEQEGGCTGSQAAEICPAKLVYQLHVGRYGKKVSGIAVRYLNAEGLDSFDKANECGCFPLQSGVAFDDGIAFRLFDDDVPRCPSADFEPKAECANPPRCGDIQLDLRGDDALLEGVIRCADPEGDEPSARIRFVPVGGRPRSECTPCG